MRTLALAAVSLVATACVAEETPVIVDHYQVPCFSSAEPALCLRVQRDGEEAFTTYDEPIVGFEADWGKRFELTVIRSYSLATGSEGPFTWELLEQTGSTTVDPGTAFLYPVPLSSQASNAAFITVNDDDAGGELADGKAFTCPDPSVCITIRSAGTEGTLDVQFAYGDPISGPLLATSASTRLPVETDDDITEE